MFTKLYAYKKIGVDGIDIYVKINETKEILSKLSYLEPSFFPASSFMEASFSRNSIIRERYKMSTENIVINIIENDVVSYQKYIEFFKQNISDIRFNSIKYNINNMSNIELIQFIKHYKDSLDIQKILFPVIKKDEKPHHGSEYIKKHSLSFYVDDIYFLITDKFFGFMGATNMNEHFILTNKTLIPKKFNNKIFNDISRIEVFISSNNDRDTRSGIIHPIFYYCKTEEIYINVSMLNKGDKKKTIEYRKYPFLPVFSKNVKLFNNGSGNMSFVYKFVG